MWEIDKKASRKAKTNMARTIRNQIEEIKFNYQDIETLTTDRYMQWTLINENAM